MEQIKITKWSQSLGSNTIDVNISVSLPGTLSNASTLFLVMKISGISLKIIMIRRAFKAVAKPLDRRCKKDAELNLQLYNNMVIT